MECPICVGKYNISNHKKITCAFCDYSGCKSCVQEYLLSSFKDAHCMNCSHLWNREFLDKYCTKTFRNGAYKRHRQKILMEREKMLMPSTQAFVSRELKARQYSKIYDELTSEIDTLYKKRAFISENIHLLRHSSVPIEEESHRKRFVRKCPVSECRGFLSSQWKCGTCETHICNQCNEPKDGGEHECNPEAVKTMELLKKDTKGCPSCGTMITFISGCRQMWCPDCHTAFDWRTGEIDTGRVHNPHYYEFKMKHNINSRENGDIPCGGLPDLYELCGALNISRRYLIERLQLSDMDTKIINVHRSVIHLDRIELAYNYRIVEEDNKDLRVKYMLNELSEEQFKIKIQRREKSREKVRDIRNILQMFVDTTSDLLRQLVIDKNQKDNIYEHISKLISYTGAEFYNIGRRYDCVVPYFDYTWNFRK